ncbi:MAG: tyrosine-protein phosphatase [Lachnospirales bacterium]
MNIIRLPLEGTKNTRDIGGYIGDNNRIFRWKKVLRSDCMSGLTLWDKEFLIDKYNLKRVIDLRSKYEIEAAKNCFEMDNKVKYINIPLADDLNPTKSSFFANINESFLTDLYIDIIENKKSGLKKVIEEIIALGENESVVFHCTAGKDRTGIITMLLLGICGVSKQDIATNYIQTATNLKYSERFAEGNEKIVKEFDEKVAKKIEKFILGSEAEFIEYAYDKLIEKYGTFKEYYLNIGIDLSDIEKLIVDLTCDFE